MANNRIYIRCKQCGDVLYLGKTFGSCYYWYNYKEDGEHLEDRLNAFYDKHEFCYNDLENNYYKPKLNESIDRYSMDNQFDICYEVFEGDTDVYEKE